MIYIPVVDRKNTDEYLLQVARDNVQVLINEIWKVHSLAYIIVNHCTPLVADSEERRCIVS